MAADRGSTRELRGDELDMAWFADCDVLHVSGYALMHEPVRSAAIHAGELAQVNGWLGAFEVKWRNRNPIDLDRCTRCNACIDVCPEGAIDALYQIDLDACRDHRACVKACGDALAIDFNRVDAPQALSGQFDLIFDLNDAPAFAQHQPPQGGHGPQFRGQVREVVVGQVQ